jgi:hypothetical protein
MKIEILPHARERMAVYGVSEDMVKETLENPDKTVAGYSNRFIAQRKLDGYVLRVVYEEKHSTKTVITVYKAKSDRYEI